MLDGPYIRKHPHLPNAWQALSPNNQGVMHKTILSDQPEFCAPARLCLTHEPVNDIALSNVDKFAVLSDVHGQFETLAALLMEHGVIDSQYNWVYGNGHLVMLGDIFDRGLGVIKIFWLLYKLQAQAEAAEGRVHCLLGNHEFMIMRNSWRYLEQSYKDFAQRLNLGYNDLFSKSWVLGSWMQSWPTMLRINDNLFVHGGLSATFLAKKLSMQTVNDLARASFGIEREAVFAHPEYGCIHNLEGPFWYRGYFKPKEGLTEADVAAGVAQYGAKRVIVGHTPQQHIRSRFNGKVIGVDNGIQLKGRGEILLFQNNEFFTGDLTGAVKPLQAVSQPNDLETE